MKTRTDVVPQLISSTLSKQDEDAAEVDESQKVEPMALVAHDEAPVVVQPREEPFDDLASPPIGRFSTGMRFLLAEPC